MAAFWQKVLAHHGIDRDDSPAVADTAYNRHWGTNYERIASRRAQAYMDHARRFETESEPGLAEIRRLTGGAPPNPAVAQKDHGGPAARRRQRRRKSGAAHSTLPVAVELSAPARRNPLLPPPRRTRARRPRDPAATTPDAGATQTSADPTVPAAEWKPSEELKAQHREAITNGTPEDIAAFEAARDAEKAAFEAGTTTAPDTATPTADQGVPCYGGNNLRRTRGTPAYGGGNSGSPFSSCSANGNRPRS